MDFVPLRREIAATEPAEGAVRSVTMHDGSTVHFRMLAEDYDPTNREAAYSYVRAAHARGEVATGLLYIDQGSPDMHEVNGSVGRALTSVPFEELCPGNAKLQELMEEYR